jgi:hypothetical protein
MTDTGKQYEMAEKKRVELREELKTKEMGADEWREKSTAFMNQSRLSQHLYKTLVRERNLSSFEAARQTRKTP